MPTATFQQQRANGDVPTGTCQREHANGNIPTAICQQQHANNDVPMAKCRRQRANGTCQRHMPTAHANGDLPTATSQRQRANGNVPTATCQRLCSKFPEEFPVQCHFKNVGCADLSNYVFVVFNEYCCDFYIGIRRFSNNVDVFITYSHASRRHCLFLALSVPNSNFVLRAIGFLHVCQNLKEILLRS